MFRGFYPDSCRGVVSGGRYDALTKKFGVEVPAIGFSVKLAEFIKVF